MQSSMDRGSIVGPGSTLDQMSRKQKYKLALIGSLKTGKSALVARFQDSSCFVEDYIPTVVDNLRQNMIITDPSDGMDRNVQLEIKDIGRAYWKEKLATGTDPMKEQMLQEQDALIFCYDLTDADTFYALSPMF
jgi:GTPase SAR1 family protein